MRISRLTIFAFVLGAIPLAPAFGFDGSPVNAPIAKDAAIGVVSPQPKALNKPVPPTYGPTADVSWTGADPTTNLGAAGRK